MNMLPPSPDICRIRAKEYCRRHYHCEITELKPLDRACAAYVLGVKCGIRPQEELAAFLGISLSTLRRDIISHQFFYAQFENVHKKTDAFYRYILYNGIYTRSPYESCK